MDGTGRKVASARWVLPLTGGLALGLLVLAGRLLGRAEADFADLLPTVAAVIHLDLANAYPVKFFATSPPGYALLAAVPMALAQPFLGLPRAFGWVGMLAPAALAVAAVVLTRALVPTARWPRQLAAGFTVLVVPGVPHAVFRRVGADIGIFHPQDVVAAAVLLLAVAAAIRQSWTLAGLLLGVALLTRQWALLPAVALLAAVPPEGRVAFSAAAGGIWVAGFLPFLLAAPEGTVAALIARGAVPTDQSLVGYLIGDRAAPSSRLAFTIARGLPLFAALGLGGVLAWYWQSRAVTAAGLLGGVLACLSLRTLLDVAFFPYYLAPLSALMLSMTVARFIPVLLGAGWLIVLAALTATSPVTGAMPSLLYASVVFAMSALALGIGLMGATELWVARRSVDIGLKPRD